MCDLTNPMPKSTPATGEDDESAEQRERRLLEVEQDEMAEFYERNSDFDA